LRDADEPTRAAMREAEHAIWLQGPDVWGDWRQARQLWATKPAVWFKRYQAARPNGKETLTPAAIAMPPPAEVSRLAAKARALIAANDPDAVRDGLREIADALDAMAGMAQADVVPQHADLGEPPPVGPD
jgi:hypothetical protein